MKMYVVSDSVEDQFWGPYTKKLLADKVLKFVQKAIDPDAEIHEEQCDKYEKEIMAGLMPTKISLEIMGGIAQEPVVEITWPPEKEEGIIINQVGYREYFFWSKNRTEAILKMARYRIDKPGQAEAHNQEAVEEMLLS